MLADLFKILMTALGFMGGNSQINPQMPGPMAKVMDKFAVIAAAAGSIMWLLGNRADVVSLNYLELAGVVLIFNMAFKADPPDKPQAPGGG